MKIILKLNLVKQQEPQEAEEYNDLMISPAEAAEIVKKEGGDFQHMTRFALDMIRHYIDEPSPVPFDALTDRYKAAQIAYALLEAGRIIGVRQQRAKQRVNDPQGILMPFDEFAEKLREEEQKHYCVKYWPTKKLMGNMIYQCDNATVEDLFRWYRMIGSRYFYD